MFVSVEQMFLWLVEHEKLILTSKSTPLTPLHILLQSLSTGDFNPARCVPGFAPYSFFKGIISHGIGTVARAEGKFLELMQFAEPVETIALGIENLVYNSPLRCGDVYYYVFEISNLRQATKRPWNTDSH